jgi:hypothetical protein
MNLTNEEKGLMAGHIASFAMRMVLQGVAHDPVVMTEELDEFQTFICNALEAAKRDARREVLITTLN